MIFEKFHFHDSVIRFVEYDGRILTLHIPKSYYESTYSKLKVKIRINEDDIRIRLLKQYPRLGAVKYKGRELSLFSLTRLLKKGLELTVCELLESVDSNYAVFECVLTPCAKKRGVYKKIYLELGDIQSIEFEKISDDSQN